MWTLRCGRWAAVKASWRYQVMRVYWAGLAECANSASTTALGTVWCAAKARREEVAVVVGKGTSSPPKATKPCSPVAHVANHTDTDITHNIPVETIAMSSTVPLPASR